MTFEERCETLRILFAGSRPPPIADVDDLVAEFYAMPNNGAGGNLHVVLDDSNLEDEHIDWCIEHARKEGDRAAYALARLLRAMPIRSRLGLDCACDCGCLDELRAELGIPVPERRRMIIDDPDAPRLAIDKTKPPS